MKILHISTSDLEGGAARAAYRLHKGLISIGVDSQMLVRAKDSLDKTVIAKQDLTTRLGPIANSLPLKFYDNRKPGVFSSQWFYDSILASVKEINPQLINLHWICNGFLKIENIAKLNKPIVWTMHDMWVFTGGCHYTEDCENFTNTCGNCPQLESDRKYDLSYWNLKRKIKAWQKLNLTNVSPSKWLADCSQKSFILEKYITKVIPHGLDLYIYKPIKSSLARQMLGLPTDKKLVLFGSSPGTTADKRKGLQFLIPAIEKLSYNLEKIELVIFGSREKKTTKEWGFKVHYLGQFYDDISLSLVYSAVDVMVVPSLQEAFGQTASESLACGTPVVAFDATGLKDIVDHKLNGYLAKPYEAEDLATGIAWVLEDEDRHQKLRINAREKAEREFSLELQAKRYLSLYQEILK